MAPLDVLYATTSYPPAIGGAQIHLHSLARSVQALGHTPHVVTHWSSGPRNDWLRGTTVFSPPPKTYEIDGIPVEQIGFASGTRMAMAPWAALYYPFMRPSVSALARLMTPSLVERAGQPDVIHASRIGREFIARAALDLARARGVPFVLTPNHHPRWKGYLYREFDRIYREADVVLALTEHERQTLVQDKGVDESRVHVTGIGPVLSEAGSAAEFRSAYGIDGPFVLYLGQQLRYKGVGAVLAAAPLVWKSRPETRFVFAGPHSDYSRDLFQGVQDRRVINLGAVDIETKTTALAACECLCLPSVQESFGGVFVEAWSQRKPVIAGDIPPIACVVSDGVDGILSSQEPHRLADAMLQLLDNPAAARAMGEAGYRKVQERYTWERIAERTVGIYRAALGAAR